MSDQAPFNIPLLELQRAHCREVTGTGEDGLALFCGHPRSGPTSYCAQHRRINLMMVTRALGMKPKILRAAEVVSPRE